MSKTDFIVYGFIATCMLLPIVAYALVKKKPQVAAYFGVALCFLMGVFVLLFTMTFDEVTLAIKGGPKVFRQEHPIGFYLAVLWNVVAGFSMITGGCWLAKRGSKKNREQT